MFRPRFLVTLLGLSFGVGLIHGCSPTAAQPAPNANDNGNSNTNANENSNSNQNGDGEDIDTLADLSCADGQVARWNSAAWVCDDDIDTDTDTLADLSCTDGQVTKWNGAAWLCNEDIDTDTLDDLSCADGQVAKWNGAAWLCDDDIDTDADSLGALSCDDGEIAKWNNGTAQWECATDDAGGGDANTLDEAYDSGGAGAGRTITADAGAVEILGSGGLAVAGSIQSGSSIIIDGTANTITSTGDLELHVNDGRALLLETNATSPNLLGGYNGNSVKLGAVGVTISGGGQSGGVNRVFDDYTTISGGKNNQAGSDDADPSGILATVGGGNTNIASGSSATVGGGGFNVASGSGSTVPGGQGNTASGLFSFAAGHLAKANHSGAFVWADGTNANFTSTAVNQFNIRAGGGTRIFSDTAATVGVQLAAGGNSWSAMSDRAVKENFTQLDPAEVLEKLAQVPVTQWNLKSQDPSIQHIGPMAQDFHAAFGVGESDRYISSSDADGVSLAAIQGLYEMVKEKDAEIQVLQARLARLEAVVTALATKSPPTHEDERDGNCNRPRYRMRS